MVMFEMRQAAFALCAASLTAFANNDAAAQATEAPAEAFVQLMGAPQQTLRWNGYGDSRSQRQLCLFSPTERAELVLTVTRLTPQIDAVPFVFAITDAAGRTRRSEPMIQGEARWIVAADAETCASPNGLLEVILPAEGALASVSGLHDISLSLTIYAR